MVKSVRIFFTLLLNFGLTLGIRCYYCNVNMAASDNAIKIVSCAKPAQWVCPPDSDSCIKMILHNSMLKDCVRPNQNYTLNYLKICEKLNSDTHQNCKICTADLCNSAPIHHNQLTIVLLILFLLIKL